MPVRRLAVLLAVLLLAPVPVAAAAEPAVRDGHDGRTLLDTWRFSRDDDGPFEPVRVPHVWNAADDSYESMTGGVGWYRKDFRLPSADPGLRWIVRFESVNYRARIYLNGRRIAMHRGAYLPFEVPLTGVRRRGTNRLEVRVDSVRKPTDFPPSRINTEGVPAGGWFNSSGIIREVTLRAVRGVDLRRVSVRPELRCARCDARVRFAVRLRGMDRVARTVAVTGRFGRRAVRIGTVRVPAGGTRDLVRRITVRDPRLWSPADPELYDVRVDARAGGRRLAGWTGHAGVRSVEVRGGRLWFNGEPANVRGMGFHEEVRGRGMALTRDDREWLVAEAKAIGATMLRTHYPPGADLLELADREGLMVWSEVPVYSVRSTYLGDPPVRERALRENAANVHANGNHPSVVVWSIGNELSPNVGPAVGTYMERAVELLHRLDPTRPVALATHAYPSYLCQPEYAVLDLIGVNDYFGWYPGPGGELFDRTRLSEYLDALRACYPDEALMVTEFGAEANREGPVEEKGTWTFQQEFVDYHLGVFASKPWLSGALYWALNEFRVRPEWEGGNPRPAPPVHQKGLVTYDERKRKPAWENVRRWYAGEVPGAAAPSPPPG